MRPRLTLRPHFSSCGSQPNRGASLFPSTTRTGRRCLPTLQKPSAHSMGWRTSIPLLCGRHFSLPNKISLRSRKKDPLRNVDSSILPQNAQATEVPRPVAPGWSPVRKLSPAAIILPRTPRGDYRSFRSTVTHQRWASLPRQSPKRQGRIATDIA